MRESANQELETRESVEEREGLIRYTPLSEEKRFEAGRTRGE